MGTEVKNEYGADQIQILEGLEAVRKRPGMYIGSVGTKGLNHLIYEIVDNSVDEHLAGYCSEITVTLEKDGKSVDASRLMAVMGMGVKKDQTVTVTVEGDDEDAACEAIKAFFETNL